MCNLSTEEAAQVSRILRSTRYDSIGVATMGMEGVPRAKLYLWDRIVYCLCSLEKGTPSWKSLFSDEAKIHNENRYDVSDFNATR